MSKQERAREPRGGEGNPYTVQSGVDPAVRTARTLISFHCRRRRKNKV